MRRLQSHLTTGHSRISLTSREPPIYCLIDHGTVPLTCCLELISLRVEVTIVHPIHYIIWPLWVSRYAIWASQVCLPGLHEPGFQGFIHCFVIVYIDDILIYSRNLADHRQHVVQVLQKLHQHHLFLKLEKCEFHRPTVQFLGYIVGQAGIQMDQGKVEAVKEWSPSQTAKELQKFLGFPNFYRRFIKDFSQHTSPLTSMSWNSSVHEASNELQHGPHPSASRS